MALVHECPRCGIETDGAWSEGGLKWAVCERCMHQDHHNRELRERHMPEDQEYDREE